MFLKEATGWLKEIKCTPDVPESLNPFPANAPHNRLGLAMWFTSKQNPLTARTMVNRIWEQLFGTGLVETLEDLGSQGALPTHPELLDWLSYQFMNDDNWSVKKLIRRIVMSATYQQDSKITPDTHCRKIRITDIMRGGQGYACRQNRYVIRHCVSAENFVIQCMAPVYIPGSRKESGSLHGMVRIGSKARADQQYRRALYTYWKRSAAYPSMITFDGISREVCTADAFAPILHCRHSPH